MSHMPRRDFYFLGFVLATFIYLVSAAVGEHFQIASFDMALEIVICTFLTMIFPEPGPGLGWGRRSALVLALVTVGLCAVWTLGFWIWTPHSSNFEWGWMIVFPFFGLIVVTPWFEEKLLRHLLLYSAEGWVGPLVASMLVSLLFAIAHRGVMVWAFIVSLALCWMRFKFKAKTVHCVVVHGLINAYVLVLYML